MNTTELLVAAVERGASDIFIIAGSPIVYKIYGGFVPVGSTCLDSECVLELVGGLYGLTNEREISRARQEWDDDFAVSIAGVSRFRVSVYKQRGSLAAVVRVIRFDLPSPEEVGIPPTVMDLTERGRGLILVTGTAGAGKSTTLACMIDRINKTRNGHIVTLEDPLEFLHRHEKSIVSQREISIDTQTYVGALRACLRQAPDVILLGEMRDHETISVAMTAAETGHLVLSTLHTIGAANTIDRIIDAFPPNQQGQIRIQLSMVLQAVVSQQLIPTTQGGILPAFEIMVATGAVRNMIREAKTHQIEQVMQSAGAEGMSTMDASILSFYKKGLISRESALTYCINPDTMDRKISIGN